LSVRLHARLRRLEGLIGVARNCPACRQRQNRAVLIEYHKLADGTVVPDAPEPAPCAVCGKVPERLIQVILTAVENPGEPATARRGEPA
jgi:hypothetical protein